MSMEEVPKNILKWTLAKSQISCDEFGKSKFGDDLRTIAKNLVKSLEEVSKNIWDKFK